MPKFRKLLKNRDFTLYSVGQAFSQFGDRLVHIVLIGFVYKRWPGSTMQLAKLFLFTVLPSFFISPVAGVYIDRWNKKRVLILSDVIRAVSILLVPVLFLNQESILPIYMVIFLIFAAACFFLPARLAIIPSLVPKEDLLLANSASSITWVVSGLMGFSLGGLIAEWIGIEKSLYANSIVYVFSAISFTALLYFARKRNLATPAKKSDKNNIKTVLKKSFFEDLWEGLRTLFKEKKIRFVLYVSFLLTSMIGAFYVVAVVFVQEVLKSMTRHVGIFGMCLFLGLLVGSYLYGKIGQKLERKTTIFVSLILAGVCINVFVIGLRLMESFWFGCASCAILGFFLAPIYVTINTIVHESVDSNLRGRIFSSLGIVMNMGFITFMFISSKLAERVDKFWILIGCGSIFAIYGVINSLVGFLRKDAISS